MRGFFGLLVVCLAGQVGFAEDTPARVLLFTKSAGFEHSVIKPTKDGSPCLVERVLTELGHKHNFVIHHTKDGSIFNSDAFKSYDVFAFYTTGDLTTASGDKNPGMSAAGKQALFEAIKAGKGFIGFHSAADTFHAPSGPHSYVVDETPDPYSQMIGAEFIEHGPQQSVRAVTIDAAFPGIEGFGEGASLMEEWYSFKQYPKDLHVLQILDTANMKGNMYQRASYPITWLHPFGKGKVFYTALGHREDVWENPIYQQLVAGGIDYALGRVKVNEQPNIETAAPKYAELPPAPEKKEPAKPASDKK
jgi:type 1 glutamine amidotransferase